jgi:hypothetical protein
VHIPKTGGQSIEKFFLDTLGLSWEQRAPLLLRTNTIKELGPPRLAHLTANEYTQYKYITDKLFLSYFKFSFVRNPWARLVSHYRYNNIYSLYPFRFFVKNLLVQKYYKKDYWFLKPQHEFIYSRKGELLIDFVGKFENIKSDFKYITLKLGIDNAVLPHINKSKNGLKDRILCKLPWIDLKNNTIKVDYRRYYDSKTRDIISKLYEKDIELFGYDFFE